MSESLPVTPTPKDQIAGLTFGMLLVDPDTIIREVNPAAENLIGRSVQRLAGQPLFDTLDFGELRLQDRFADIEAQLIARGVPMRVGNRRIRVNLTISALPSHPGWRSLTLSDAGPGERFGEDERRGTLRGPAVLAHEIKNPLAAIRGAAQLLARKFDGSDRNLTDLIADEVDRIASLLDRMQRLGREQSEPVESTNLHEAIRRACDTVKAASTAPFSLREEFDPSLPQVLVNEGALVQVMVNLIANAGDACRHRDRPEVIVRTRFVSGLAMNVFRLGRPVKLPIEVQVSDNGPGIDPSVRDHIFEPFISTKKNGQGLGLALVNKLVRDMDGRITHERDETAGMTHFRVHLPIAR